MTAEAIPLAAFDRLVRPQGDLDVATAPAFRQSLVDAINDGGTRVVVDMSEVTFIDSTGLGVLVGALKRARSMDVELVVTSPTTSIRKVFEISGITSVLATP